MTLTEIILLVIIIIFIACIFVAILAPITPVVHVQDDLSKPLIVTVPALTPVQASVSQSITGTSIIPPPIQYANGTYSITGGQYNKYCSDESAVRCNRDVVGPWERFLIENNSDGTVSIKGGQYNKYCSDEGNLNCNKDVIGDWERFLMRKNNDGTATLNSVRNTDKYCTDFGNNVNCDSKTQVGVWEKFKFNKV